ncbi:MAG: SIMPL domain-containing protein [Caldisericia bacterium]
MKKNTLILTVAIVVGSILVGTLGAFGVAGAANTPEDNDCDLPRIISVNGNGVVTVKPDKFTINFTVWTQMKSAREAQQTNDKKANDLIDALKDAGITEDDMVTSGYRLDTAYEWDQEARKNVLVGYRASYTLVVTTYDLADMGAIIDLATSNGVNNIGTIQYGVKDREALATEALKLAMQDAKAKANIALGEYDLETLKVRNIYINTFDPIAVPYAEKNMLGRGGVADEASVAPTIISGELTHTVNVSVEFEF